MEEFRFIPNALTLVRIFLLPFIVVFIVREAFTPALYFFLVCAVTDFLDGFFARKLKSVTKSGILLDPIADKLLTSSVLISLAYVRLCDPYSVIVIVGREEIVTGMRAIAGVKGLVIPADAGGKIKTAMIMVSVILFLSGKRFAGEVMLVLSAVVAVITGINYFYKFFLFRREGVADA